jgi:hypothetical protein
MVFVLFLLVLAANVESQAQTYSVLYSFGQNGAEDITDPSGLMIGQDSNLYGAGIGQYGEGINFKFTPQGTLTTLFDFGPDCPGNYTTGLTWGSDGNLYGAVGGGAGGSCTFGDVFKVTPSGSSTVLGTVDIPQGPPIQATDGSLYGTACGLWFCYLGSGYGTIYKITPPGTFTRLYEFDLTTELLLTHSYSRAAMGISMERPWPVALEMRAV